MHLGQSQDPVVKIGRGNVISLRVDVEGDAGTGHPWISHRKRPELDKSYANMRNFITWLPT